MALPAVLAKLVIMRILMTTCAVNILKTRELLEFFPVVKSYFVTFGAFNISVLSGKPEPGIVVIENWCGGKGIFLMALKAVR